MTFKIFHFLTYFNEKLSEWIFYCLAIHGTSKLQKFPILGVFEL